MNKRTFIHVLLIAALCFSQLAANVHMAGHLQGKPEVSFASFTNSSALNLALINVDARNNADALTTAEALTTARHHSHTDHHHGHSALTDRALKDHITTYHSIVEHGGSPHHSDNDNYFDCAIYHAYLGQSGCPSAFANGFSITPRGVSAAPKETAHVATLARHHRPIRGPPSHS